MIPQLASSFAAGGNTQPPGLQCIHLPLTAPWFCLVSGREGAGAPEFVQRGPSRGDPLCHQREARGGGGTVAQPPQLLLIKPGSTAGVAAAPDLYLCLQLKCGQHRGVIWGEGRGCSSPGVGEGEAVGVCGAEMCAALIALTHVSHLCSKWQLREHF